MRILGTGLLARSLRPYERVADDAVAYAKGVASSLTTDEWAYRRETSDLEALVRRCRASGERLAYFSGGGAIYGDAAHPWRESDQPLPTSLYGRHQLACESIIQGAGIRYLIARLPNLVGSRQNAEQLVPALVSQALLGHARLYRNATRDLLDAGDAARMIAMLLSLDERQLLVNVASGRSTPVDQIFAEIQRIAGTDAAVDFVDGGDRQVFSIELLGRLLGHQPERSPDYPWRVLARHIPGMVRELVRA